MKKDKIYQFLKKKGLHVVIVLALIIRVSFFVSLRPWDEKVVEKDIIVYDAVGYNELALSFLSNRSFEDFDAFRTPGYPLFIAFIFDLSANSISLVLLVQILISLLSVYYVYKIGELSFSRKIGLISASLFTIDLLQVLYTVSLLTETVFVFLFLVSAYHFLKWLIENNLISLLLSALFLGLATLFRPIIFLFPIIIISFLFLSGNIRFMAKLKYSLLFCCIFLATISPWLIRNYSKYGEPKLTSISGSNLLYYNAAFTEAYKTGNDIKVVQKTFEFEAIKLGLDTLDLNSFKNSQICSGIAKKYIKENFLLCCKTHLIGIVGMYASLGKKSLSPIFHIESGTQNFDFIEGPDFLKSIREYFRNITLIEILLVFLMFLYLSINYLFSFYGIFIQVINNKTHTKQISLKNILTSNLSMFFFILIILYFSVLTGIVGYSRYRLPFMPFINILCAVGIISFYDNSQSKTRKKY